MYLKHLLLYTLWCCGLSRCLGRPHPIVECRLKSQLLCLWCSFLLMHKRWPKFFVPCSNPRERSGWHSWLLVSLLSLWFCNTIIQVLKRELKIKYVIVISFPRAEAWSVELVMMSLTCWRQPSGITCWKLSDQKSLQEAVIWPSTNFSSFYFCSPTDVMW